MRKDFDLISLVIVIGIYLKNLVAAFAVQFLCDYGLYQEVALPLWKRHKGLCGDTQTGEGHQHTLLLDQTRIISSYL